MDAAIHTHRLNTCMGNDDKYWIVVPSGEGGKGMGLGRDYTMYFKLFFYAKNLKTTK